MNISRILKTALPAAAALSLLATSPAVAADYTGCTAKACGSVYGYRYKAIPGFDTFEIWIDNMIVRDTVRDDGSFPGIKLVHSGGQIYYWGNDNGTSQLLGGDYLYDLKDVWFQVCQNGGPCKTLSRS
jgi:hypothetical protein